MFKWDGCPFELLDSYMSVGKIEEVRGFDENWCYIEIQMGGNQKIRRPIYGILKQLLKIAVGRPICLLFMGDDINDTSFQAIGISMLLTELKKQNLQPYSVMYTQKSMSELLERKKKQFIHFKDEQYYNDLFQTIDIFVTKQAHRFAVSENREVFGETQLLKIEL